MRRWTSPTGRVAVVSPSGELDVAKAGQLRQCLIDLCDLPGVRLVVVDLGDVVFLDSTILGVFVGASKRCTHDGIEFRVTNATGIPAKALRLTGLGFLLSDEERQRLPR